MDRRVIVSLIGVLVVGIVVGVVVGRAADGSNEADSPPATTITEVDDSTEAGSPSPTVSEVDCAEAQSVVDGASANLSQINADANEPSANLFAALVVEQRTITFAMDARPECFDLAVRAANAGLLDGLTLLAGAAELGAGAPLETPGSGVASTVPTPPEQPGDTGAPSPTDGSGE